MDPRKYSILSHLKEDILKRIRIVSVFGLDAQDAIFVTDSDEVFALGQNKDGCLGLGNADEVYDNPEPIPSLNSLKIKGFAFGSNFTFSDACPFQFAFSETGTVFFWNIVSPYPKIIKGCLLNKKVIDVACGTSHALVLCDDGMVFGYESYNMNKDRNVEANLKVTQGPIKGKFVTAICCGPESSFAIVDNGSVYAWGDNKDGVLGVDHKGLVVNPLQISKLAHVTISKVVCGKSRTLALDVAGELYEWGSDLHGPFEVEYILSRRDESVPAKNELLKSVIDIAATSYSNMCVAQTEDTRIYMWGCCKGHGFIQFPLLTLCNSFHEVFAHYGTPAITYKPLKPESNSKNLIITSLIESYENAFDNEETGDLIIIVEDKQIYVHKTVLKLRSQYFRNMFRGSWKEAKEEILKIEDFNYEIYRAYLKYLYTGETKFNPVLAAEVYALAHLHCDEGLKKICINTIRRGILLTNVSDLYAVAVKHTLEEVEDLCIPFILKHATELFNSPEILKWNVEMKERFFQKFTDRTS